MPEFNTQEPTTETALIELSIKIGSIANCNSLFTQGFSQYIDSLDKPLSEITACELADLIDQYREAFDYPEISTQKTSRFTVLRKSNHSRIAENITYEQALQYQDNDNLVIKFFGMVARSAS